MRPFTLALAAALVCALPAGAKLEIQDFQACHGPYGPERTSPEVYPQDEYGVRFTVVGAKADGEHKARGSLLIQVKNADGKVVEERTAGVQKELDLGGDRFVVHGSIPVGEKFATGDYTLSINYRDRLSSESASVERKFRVVPTSFQIIVPRFYRDAQLKIPGPAGGLTGETLHLKVRVIGFDKSQKKVQTRLTVECLEGDGDKVVSTPVNTRADLNSAEEAAKAHHVNFSGAVQLNRPGRFRLRFTAEDLVGNKKATFETPLTVTAP